jgi:hypothetical protein
VRNITKGQTYGLAFSTFPDGNAVRRGSLFQLKDEPEGAKVRRTGEGSFRLQV